MNVRTALSKLPPVQHQDIVTFPEPATNADIISTLHRVWPTAVKQTTNIADSFKDRSISATASKLWHWLKTNVQYIPDGEDEQWIRLPNVLLSTGKGDCKSYALFANSVLYNLGLPAIFRYVSYDRSNPTPTHVYAITKDEIGRTVIIDPVYDQFNSEKSFASKHDVKMKVGVMTGIGMDAKYARLESICRQYLSARSGVNGIGKVTFKKVALAIPRNAYLALVALNVFGIASKLNDAIAKNSPGVQKVWGKLGGDFSKLKNTVADGARKKPPLNIKGIGDPITLASIGTFLATAAPVAAAVGSVVKQVVGDSTDVVNTLNTAAKAAGGVSDIITNITTPPVAEPDPNAPLSFTNPGPDGVTWAWTSPEYKQVKIKPSGKVVTIPDSIKKSGYDPNKPVSVTNRPGVAPDSGPISQWLIDNGYVPNNVTLFSPDGSQIIVTDAEPGSASDAGSTSQSSALPWIAGGILALKAFSII